MSRPTPVIAHRFARSRLREHVLNVLSWLVIGAIVGTLLWLAFQAVPI